MDPTLSLSERTPEQIASEINAIKSRTGRIMPESCVEIGRRLTEVRDMIPYGGWGQWLKQEVSYSQVTATRLMRVHKEFGPRLASQGESLSENFSTLKNLSFSKAVSRLGIPAGEREEFLTVHDVKNMSAREMQAAVQCTNSKSKQKVVTKPIWDNDIEQAEDFRHSPPGRISYRLRSQTMERVFADAKEKYALRYTLFKGLTKEKNWVKFKFAAMNRKKLALWAC